MHRLFCLLLYINLCSVVNAQLVEVVNNSTSGGDVIFGATNFSKTPVFLKIEFTELQNTTNDDMRMYYSKLKPGYNSLFSLAKGFGAGSPYYYYKIKTYRSDPTANVNLDFPYLIPLSPGKTATVFDVKSIDGFWGNEKLVRWAATGFNVQSGDKVYASRSGEIVEIVDKTRSENPEQWYNTWLNVITILQPDGTLITYKNVIDSDQKLRLNQKVYAGELLGEVVPNETELVVMIYHNTIRNDDLMFVIPQFVTAPGKIEMLNTSMDIKVVHPVDVCALEMTKREQRRILRD